MTSFTVSSGITSSGNVLSAGETGSVLSGGTALAIGIVAGRTLDVAKGGRVRGVTAC